MLRLLVKSILLLFFILYRYIPLQILFHFFNLFASARNKKGYKI